MKILLFTPPLIHPREIYPAPQFLAGYLKKINIDSIQEDISIRIFNYIFSNEGLSRIHKQLNTNSSKNIAFFIRHYEEIQEKTPKILSFLQRQRPELAVKIVYQHYIPATPLYKNFFLRQIKIFHKTQRHTIQKTSPKHLLDLNFGKENIQEQATMLASLFITFLAKVIQKGIDSHLRLDSYAEDYARSQSDLRSLLEKASSSPTSLIEQIMDEQSQLIVRQHQPDIMGITVPFDGTLYGTLRVARQVKKILPTCKVIIGGGLINTRFRNAERVKPLLESTVDFITYDDGEKPLENIIKLLSGDISHHELIRTVYHTSIDGLVKKAITQHGELSHADKGTPYFKSTPNYLYLSYYNSMSPWQRIMYQHPANSIMLAHGCYWKKCAFCDVNIDYIGRYEHPAVEHIADQIEEILNDTHNPNFHFVDEAAPPKLLRELAKTIIKRNLNIKWRSMIRFDKAFTPSLAQLLADSGCTFISGGLEVASDNILKRINKGVSIKQAVHVTSAFYKANVPVHAFLMQGFPGQTLQETVNSLETIRQFFKHKLLTSAFWAKFELTAGSPVASNPVDYGITITPAPQESYYLKYDETPRLDHNALTLCLKKALAHFTHQSGLDIPAHQWFTPLEVPQATIDNNLIQHYMSEL
jgi:radical SAM superfamily enzyme YgiQ (UPF0313 family)